tara:strand:- start:1320 stop:1574 length:255 start_codon:yes stop_codon:yes gene_type:complete
MMNETLRKKYEEVVDKDGNVTENTIAQVAYDIGYYALDAENGVNMPTNIGIVDDGDNWETWANAYTEGVRDREEDAIEGYAVMI